MNDIALCIITSQADESKAHALGETLKPFVDQVIITGPKEFPWVDNFSAARLFNFSQTEAEWILWLDADDTLTNPGNIRELVEYAEKNKIEGYFFPYQYAFDERGNCVEEHWKLQLVKNDGHAEWRGAIHEDLIQLRPARWVKSDKCIRVHHTDGERSQASHERNRSILLKEMERHPEEPRTYFYLGRSYTAMDEYKKAIEVLQKYLELSGWDDERYEASLLIGSCLKNLGQLDEAIFAYNSAILEKESNPDAYINKAVCYMQKSEWNKALFNFKTALGIPIPDTATFVNPLLYSRDIYSGIAVCYLHLGQLNDALRAITIALKADPKNEDLLETRKFIVSEKSKIELAQQFATLAKAIKPDKIPQLLHTVPSFLQDNEIILGMRNSFCPPKVWEDKSIAVYCGASAETWTPDSQNKGGIGGSETAVIELTKRLADRGWKVTVFNQCDAPPEGQMYGTVQYENYWKFNINDEFDVLWVWRLPELFDYKLKARLNILDLHDVMSPLDLTKARVEQIDKIFVKTNYHRSLFPNVPDEKFVVIGNGIDLKRFEKKVEKEPLRFCYTSSPNRGLDILLKMWPKIKERLPKAELHVYYGWNTFYKLEKNNPERMRFMKKVQEMMNQPGVIDHGRVGQKELAEELLKTSYWLYPTYFPEIDCITAKEMHAAGVTPITTGYAALEESQIAGVKIPGDPYDPEWQQKYIDNVVDNAEEGLTDSIDPSLFSWNNVANTWNELLSSGKELQTQGTGSQTDSEQPLAF